MKLEQIRGEWLDADTSEDNWEGLYHNLQFVLRLKPRTHRLINELSSLINSDQDISSEHIQAFSTYIHETIHWWQHIGSTAGLILSLGYPSQFQGAVEFLKKLVVDGVKVKPIKQWAEERLKNGDIQINEDGSPTILGVANHTVNNCVDIDFYKSIAVDASNAAANLRSRYFESVGHSYAIAYTAALNCIASSLDQNLTVLPRFDRWFEQFDELASIGFENYSYGSQITLAPLGMRAIFEGQARMLQLQYLSFATEGGISFDYIYAYGLLENIYGEAFEIFIDRTSFEDPEKVDSWQVGLFLVICDLSMNPSIGISSDIKFFEYFYEDVDPGVRFVSLCAVAKHMYSDNHPSIINYSRDEYENIARELTTACGYDHPFDLLSTIASWPTKSIMFEEVMEEKKSFNFKQEGQPFRLILSHFVAFSEDKLRHPEFFCWTGALMHKEMNGTSGLQLFAKNAPLFTDLENDTGVFCRSSGMEDRQAAKDTINTFFGHNIIFDLTRQWILDDGPFRYPFEWLSNHVSADDTRKAACDLFESVFGVRPKDLEILN